MERITFTVEEYLQLLNKLDLIVNRLDEKFAPQPLPDTWLDIQETCQLLKISKRSLQSYRDRKLLSFSKIGGKIYFKASDIQAHLEKHYQNSFSNKPKKKLKH